jgi:flagellar motor switch protein FliN/FliY
MAETAEAVEENKDQQTPEDNAAEGDSKIQAQSVELSEVTEGEDIGAGTSLDVLLDMNVPITVAIGRTEITVQRLLQLGEGSVLKLDKAIDDPADLYLKDTKFATGNIVVIKDQFAVRIKEILGTGGPAEETDT